MAEDGLKLEIVGCTGEGAETGLIVNVERFEVPPSGFCTLTYAEPAEARRLAGATAASCVELIKTVNSA